MQVTVHKLGGKSLSVEVEPHHLVYKLKKRIFQADGLPAGEIHLKFNELALDDSKSLAEYNIQDGSEVSASRLLSTDDPAAQRFSDNTVVTSQYTCLTFLPKFLFFAFTKLANAYFLAVAVLQCIPDVSQTQGLPTILPVLIIMITVEGSLAAAEDCRRHDADKIANNSPSQVWDGSGFVPTRWSSLRVGNIIKVDNEQPIPADLAVLGVYEPEATVPSGECYVETKSLDGETSLKQKAALAATTKQLRNDSDLVSLGLVSLECEFPNLDLGSFTGAMRIGDAEPENVPITCTVLRGSSLQQTEAMWGIVIFTGHETKVMMNAEEPQLKRSTIDNEINRLIVYVLITMWTICLAAGIAGAIFDAMNDKDMWYWGVYWNHDCCYGAGHYILDAVIDFLSYWVLIASFVSISLVVSMVLVKAFQLGFMQMNLDMYHEATDTPACVRTMNLNDELGVISYILSDKTGTLTDNIMQFRKMTVSGKEYGLGQTEIGRARLARLSGSDLSPSSQLDQQEIRATRLSQSNHVDFADDSFFSSMQGGDQEHQRCCDKMVRALALCHSAIRMTSEPGQRIGHLSAASPDELALVEAGAFFGKVFARRSKDAEHNKFIELEQPGEFGESTPEKIQLLEDLEFTSDRKRQSIIIKDQGRIELISKGADSEMWPRMDPSNDAAVMKETQLIMTEQANDGLRTLLYGSRVLDPAEFEDWHRNYKEACSDVTEIERKKNGEENRIDELMQEMEQCLTLLGSSALEDKLQAGVPQTIARMLEASIAVWMLTGDKEETAVNIAFACSFLDEETDFMKLNKKSFIGADALRESIIGFAQVIAHRKTIGSLMRHALVIDGDTLTEAMTGPCLDAFTVLIQLCDAVVANRCSPRQKSSVVQMVRTQLPNARTLSIGDGANDVPMLLAAHVGVGISGQEGLQAVNNSDFAIARFRFLTDLTLVHGKNNYLNMSTLVCYMFYKNVMISMTPYYYTAFTGMSGQKFSPEYALQLFNAIWTFLPILLLGIMDQEVARPYARMIPRLYEIGTRFGAFNFEVGAEWVVLALLESAWIVYMTVGCMGPWIVNDEGTVGGMWMLGLVVMTEAILVANFKLFACQYQWNWIQLLVLVLSIALWWPLAYLCDAKFMAASISFIAVNVEGQLGLWRYLQNEPVFWLTVVLVVGTILMADMTRIHVKRMFKHDLSFEVQSAIKAGKSDEEVYQVSKEYPQRKPEPIEGLPELISTLLLRPVTLMRNADEQTLPVETHVKTRTLKVRGGAVNTNALGPANNLPVDQPGSSVELDKISVHII